jgi:copper chaperone CopZ
MKKLTIHIPDMLSAHCQMHVTDALKNTDGINITNMESGLATITVENDGQQQHAINVIQQAGYTVASIASSMASEDMLRFQTNINCSGCVAKVTPALNAVAGISHWEVDTNSKEKILTVNAISNLTDEVMETVKNAGFSISPINPSIQ